jgi:hypothetical protein
MSGNPMHIAAVFETLAAADKAKAALVGAGVPANAVLVLDRCDNEATTPHPPSHIWARLKARLLPDHHMHHYAEAITRGHPLLLADVTETTRDAAVAALQAQHPVDLQTRVDEWQAEGWSGTYEGEDTWNEQNAGPASSDGVVGGDLIAGDYGAVGAPIGGTRVDTNILRGTMRLYSAPV